MRWFCGKRERQLVWCCLLVLVAFEILMEMEVFMHSGILSSEANSPLLASYHPKKQRSTIMVFGAAISEIDANRQKEAFRAMTAASAVKVLAVVLDPSNQKEYVRRHKCGIHRFNEFQRQGQHHLATELWKYCALQSEPRVSIFLGMSSHLVVPIDEIIDELSEFNVAVLGDDFSPRTIHGSFFLLQPNATVVARRMLSVLTTTPMELLERDPLFLATALYSIISDGTILNPGRSKTNWYVLQQKCNFNPFRSTITAESFSEDMMPIVNFVCPTTTEFCCSVKDHLKSQTILFTKYPILPFQMLTEISIPLNAAAGHYRVPELPFISSLTERTFDSSLPVRRTPNFYDILEQKNLLPDRKCNRCLGITPCPIENATLLCHSYFNAVCGGDFSVVPKFISKEIHVNPPSYRRDPTRLIPRIIHQTWYEPLTMNIYPKFNLLKESFRKSGWEWRFYTDDESKAFLKTHFPVEVLEAYDALIPGAFKADLFRYCVLLIHGGVYADIDILLETNLDSLIEPDVGFIIPHDVPDGMVWQGFVGSAPGHPFLVKAIQGVVNQVRNRFTSVDQDVQYCPEPNFKLLHMFDILYTTGPGLLGGWINRVLHRRPHTPFEPGELLPITSNLTSAEVEALQALIPGRTIILKLDKHDMGAIRFTLVEQNLIAAVTDLPEVDRREETTAENAKPQDERKQNGARIVDERHYSKAHSNDHIYGLHSLYINQERANEDVMFILVKSPHWSIRKESKPL